MPPIAYSYVRFSSKKQEEGDSMRRQTELTTAWATRNGVTLDTSLAPDCGVSAFRGRNRDIGALGEFLQLVDAGRVAPGSYLVVESLDRLTREEIQRAMLLVLSLLQKGIRVVQLKPTETIYDSASDTTPIILMLVELSRAHSESRVKSERVRAAWDRLKQRARAGEYVLSGLIPGWLERRDGRIVAVPERAAVVRRVFAFAIQGHGMSLIVRRLADDKIETWGSATGWNRAYLHKILRGRAVLGEYQPRSATKADGPPIPDFFPRVIDDATWERAQAALSSRTRASGRVGKRVANLFTGLLWDARSGSRMYIAWQGRGHGKSRVRYRVLIPQTTIARAAGGTTFPNDIFEPALLRFLHEIPDGDVTGGKPESASLGIAEELAAIDARIAATEMELAGDDGSAPALARSLKALEARRREIAAKLTAARAAEASPLSDVWAETRGLIDAARDEPERLRLRSLLQASVSDVRVLVVRLVNQVYCLAQIRFRSGTRRDALVCYLPAKRNRKARWVLVALPWPEGAGFDLKGADGVKRAEAALARLGG